MINDPYHQQPKPIVAQANAPAAKPQLDFTKAKEAAGKIVGNLARSLSLKNMLRK